MYSSFIAYLLFFLSGFGVLGLHRHYLGKHATGFLWLFTGGLASFGLFYDLFTIPSQVKEANIRKAIFEESILRNIERRKSGNATWRNVNDGEANIIREKESVERVILKLAKTNKGILTASELALSANITIEEAKAGLDALVNKGIAELGVRQSGPIVYTIPDFRDSDEPLVIE